MSLPAWYHGTREEFLAASNIIIANQLAGRAADESLEIEACQNEEWRQSIDLLQRTLDNRIPILRAALQSEWGKSIQHVVLEFDFRRRGLRMDCLLIGEGVLFVIEFKRSKIQASDRDQVMTYAVNLLEFHGLTQRLSKNSDGLIIVPIITLTKGHASAPKWPGMGGHSWAAAATRPLECDAKGLAEALMLGFTHRRSAIVIPIDEWLRSPFAPSSSILDATLSLYGNHDVSAIQDHAAPKDEIDSSVREIREVINEALDRGGYHIVFLSGAPGAGKTLVGLELVMRGEKASESVFVTGNAPLVEVLNKALQKSYLSQGKSTEVWAQTGYRREEARFVSSAAGFKIVKAHNFLGMRTENHRQDDGRVLVFDEAQRTYEKGRVVLREKLPDHEADLILDIQKQVYPTGGAVIVALVGHNQAINNGELGIRAWLEAIDRKGDWRFSIADETLKLSEIDEPEKWAGHPRRELLVHGHLRQSMRFYRNSKVEEWVGFVLAGESSKASELAAELSQNDSSVFLTRSLAGARRWAKAQTVGNQRSGLIASSQARRLAAEGIFVDFKPDIATWMLAPSSDVRSSNALETVQNQFQVQGMELDHCIVCWDADLRWEGNEWKAYKLNGPKWNKDSQINVARNCYRVLLTRARKGMVIFVPAGDVSGKDETRCVQFYDGVWNMLLKCGAKNLEAKA